MVNIRERFEPKIAQNSYNIRVEIITKISDKTKRNE